MSTFEHALYIGIGLGCVLLGLDIAIYCATIRNLYYSKSLSTRSGMLIGILSTSSLILLCINVATNAIFGEQAWITFRDTLPGGPPAWIVGNFDVWYQTLSTTCVAALIFSSDAFLIYRFHIICGSRLLLIIFPIIMWLAGLALAILEIYVSAVPGGYFFSRASINFGLPYYTISIALNVILTCGIVGRVVYFSRLLRPTLSSASLQVYTGVTAILIESAALYTVVGFMTIIPYGLNAPTSVAFGQVWTKFAAIAPQLIAMRVSSGQAWTKDLVSRAESGLEFDSVLPVSDIGTTATGYSTTDTRQQTLGSVSSKKWTESREKV